ncbi:MAG: hypothetical protein QNJ32_04805 [Xenococcaceae cyanobacterium MO_167.B27]|nr:hypothetical protein [Xenococcaceae cyanobacterium MO_167.B27]
MKPKFKTRLAWEKAQILMQPALIRVLDNIRKQLDKSSWKGSYQEITHPIPGYLLCLTKGDRNIQIDIWELCYQVCFQNYNLTPHNIMSSSDNSSCEVDIDDRLLDETGEIDWQLIEAKAQKAVRDVFENLE